MSPNKSCVPNSYGILKFGFKVISTVDTIVVVDEVEVEVEEELIWISESVVDIDFDVDDDVVEVVWMTPFRSSSVTVGISDKLMD